MVIHIINPSSFSDFSPCLFWSLVFLEDVLPLVSDVLEGLDSTLAQLFLFISEYGLMSFLVDSGVLLLINQASVELLEHVQDAELSQNDDMFNDNELTQFMSNLKREVLLVLLAIRHKFDKYNDDN